MDLNADKCIHCPGKPAFAHVGNAKVCLGCGAKWRMEYRTCDPESCEECKGTDLRYLRDGGTRICKECGNEWYGSNGTSTKTVHRVED
jgi:hypothetical protein